MYNRNSAMEDKQKRNNKNEFERNRRCKKEERRPKRGGEATLGLLMVCLLFRWEEERGFKAQKLHLMLLVIDY